METEGRKILVYPFSPDIRKIPGNGPKVIVSIGSIVTKWESIEMTVDEAQEFALNVLHVVEYLKSIEETYGTT